MLTLASNIQASWQERDVIWIGKQSYLTPVYPLERCTDYNSGKVFHAHSSGNMRDYVAVWEVAEKKLFLVFIGRDEKSTELRCYGGSIISEKSKRYLAHRWATVEGLFPKRIKEGKVFADWFSGTIFSPGNAWNKTLSPEEHKKLEARATLVITVKKGIVTNIEHRKKQAPTSR